MFQRRAEIPKSVMATPFVRGYGPTASGGLTGEGGNPAYPNCFSIPLNPPFQRGRRAYYHVYCKSFVTLQSPKAPPSGELRGPLHQKLPRSLSRKAGGDLGGFRTFSPTMLLYILIQKKRGGTHPAGSRSRKPTVMIRLPYV